MTHIGQERGAGLGHTQGGQLCRFQLIVGLAQALVAGLELQGACGDDIFQLAQVFGEAVLGVAALLDFGFHIVELLVGDVDQYADFIVFVTRWAIQAGLLAGAQCANNAHQRLGQHHVKEAQQDPGQEQAAGEPVEQGNLGTVQETAAKGVGVHVQAEYAEGITGHVAQEQPVFKLPVGAKQKIADRPISTFLARSIHVGQDHAIVVDQLRAGNRRGMQQAQGQFLSEFSIDVVGDTRGWVMADFDQ